MIGVVGKSLMSRGAIYNGFVMFRPMMQESLNMK
jgi:hypothetical protein